jgi:cytochrome d ubiquinol oxidase subunit II
MDLNTIWFILIAVLYIGFFILEGFDFGVGILMPFLSRDEDPARVDRKRRLMINTIGPHWDGNEVWLLTAGGATFAAFPEWYATMFSGFYLAFFLILLALIYRGVSFEFRSKDQHPRWRKLWDWGIFLGSLLPPLLIGVAFANILRGVPIDAEMNYVGGFFNLLNPFALIAGITTAALCTLYGAIFLTLKIKGDFVKTARDFAGRFWIIAVLLLLASLVTTYFQTDILSQLGVNPGVIPLAGVAAILLAGFFIRKRKDGLAFTMTSLTIVLALTTIFMILFPRVMVSSLNPAYSLTIYNASSTQYTLTIMTVVALIFVPVVLLYQGWSYWIFRKRLTMDSHLEY